MHTASVIDEWIRNIGGMILTEGKPEIFVEKPVTIPLVSPQIPHGLS
jgi:hypothetical protein